MAWACYSDTRSLDESRIDALTRLLSTSERERSSRLWNPRDRRDYVAAHALVRMALSAHVPIPPERLTISADSHGKPFLVAPAGVSAPSFSLAHSRNLVACVVAPAGAVGIDVEPVDNGADVAHMAERFFSAEETEALQSRPPGARSSLFCELWTLKEALLKAVGTGLSSGLDGISFRVVDHHVSLTARAPQFAEARWSFVVMDLEGTHKLALAIDEPAARRPVSVTRWDLRS
jgi:4'-phosphopantetheinyl transferase